ncbi:phytanoyl-CoA dioxygenase family protein [Paenibacillus sp. OV219]|uniref:phytanoyl-CoA dioxygenase family protein n=1 Tax=Paenibacillus sp. OV219 TaxID=1884377 RepID=UPI0008C18A22|nr:phytanoyl-CoA dioxygenase family protein [Paenibacillus sp. OV219]SEP14625.1 Ectoine hydroxylase-related dioxygenase, phytanoyl-CoA dioxygenase (PhyH) family [Paenibacillus sp. OV219]
MTTVILKEIREQLLTQGYCIIPDVLDPSILHKLRQVTEGLLAQQSAEEIKRQRSTGSMISISVDPVFAELIAWPKALEGLASLGYADPRFTSGYVISKPSQSPRLFWHYDYACWDDPNGFGDVPQQLFLMYYLVDTTPENGCLRVIPGSHLKDNPLHAELEEAHSRQLAEATNMELPAFSLRPDEINVEVKAGDLVIGDSRILHASHSNESNERRTVITLWFHPDMQALTEPVQGFIAGMSTKVPEDWPQAAKEMMAPLLARYDGEVEPLKWNRHRPARGC